MPDKKYTLQEIFKIRDAWNMLYELEFLNEYIDVYRLQQISNAINQMLEDAERG